MLTGGSAFGLAAADGVMRSLEAQGRGFSTAGGKVPIVPAAAVYDLVSSGGVRPGPDEGVAALTAAEPGGSFATGQVGAGLVSPPAGIFTEAVAALAESARHPA